MIPITESQKQIIERLSQENQFRRVGKKKGAASDLLWALFDNPDDKDARIRALHDRVSGRNVGIATEISRLQKQLDRYFDRAGKHLPLRIQIRRGNEGDRRPADLYRLLFVPNVASLSSVRKFWKLYGDGRPVAIAYGDPMFITNADRSMFLRAVDFNEAGQIDAAIAKASVSPQMRRISEQLKLIAMLKDPTPGYVFVNAGEMMCMLALTRWLASNGIHVTEEAYTHEATFYSFLNHSAGPAGANAIILGSPRVNGVLREYQKLFFERNPNAPYDLNEIGVIDRSNSSAAPLKDEAKKEDKDTLVAYGIVFRMVGVQSGAVTLLVSNTGRAIEELGRMLTSDAALTTHAEDAFNSMEGATAQKTTMDDKALPTSFQMLFRFEIGDQGRVVKTIERVDFWPKQDRRRKTTSSRV